MAGIKSKSGLAIALSRIEGFRCPKVRLEQYQTPSEIAADLLWGMHMKSEMAGKHIADMGCGTGILGLGALLMGAAKAVMVDCDTDAIKAARLNLERLKKGFLLGGKALFVQSDVSSLKLADKRLDAVVQNPPFGIKKRHADRGFLEKAMEISGNIYSFHKLESEMFIERLCHDKGFVTSGIVKYRYPLAASYSFHKKRIERIGVGLWNLRSKEALSEEEV